MTYLFDETFRSLVSARCQAFHPLPVSEEWRPLKQAAVAIALAPADDDNRAALLLTRRAQGLRAHSGQWALPGGRCDPSETAVDAALRELDEELGLALDARAVLGILDGYPTRSGYLITPVVAWAGRDAPITPNPNEVASVHRIPLADIAHQGAVDFISIPESDRPVIRLLINDRYVHAPTAAVIYQFLELVAGRDTRVFNLEQPVFAWK
jgi:8-oxo-dGTP pyrophosphatase MutT (NUDIX family)